MGDIRESRVKIGTLLGAAALLGTAGYIYSLSQAAKRIIVENNFDVGFNAAGLSSSLIAKIRPIVNNPTTQSITVGTPFVRLYPSEEDYKAGKNLIGVSIASAQKTAINEMGQTTLPEIRVDIPISKVAGIIKSAIQNGKVKIYAVVETPVHLKWGFLPPVSVKQIIAKEMVVPGFLLGLLPAS